MKTNSHRGSKWLKSLLLAMVILNFAAPAEAQVYSPLPNLWHQWERPLESVTTGLTNGVKNFFTIYSGSVYHSDSTKLRFNLFILQENLRICHDLLVNDKQEPSIQKEKSTENQNQKAQIEKSKTINGDTLSDPQKSIDSIRRPRIWNRPGTIKVRI